MIKPQDFMIGNYVNYKLNNDNYRIHKIVGLDENRIATIRFNQISEFPIYRDYFNSYFIQPIPLTEEILLKCGFEKPDRGCFQYKGIRLTQIRDLYFRGNFPIKSDIKYLHQLQNLIFSLLNEELTIQL